MHDAMQLLDVICDRHLAESEGCTGPKWQCTLGSRNPVISNRLQAMFRGSGHRPKIEI
jgi:hypothetical protein